MLQRDPFNPQSSLLRVKYIKSRARPTLKQQQQTTEKKQEQQQQPSATITNLHQNHHYHHLQLPIRVCVSQSFDLENLHQQQQLSNLKTSKQKTNNNKKITITPRKEQMCMPEK